MAENPSAVSKYHRPYQSTILRCNSAYKVLRLGRRSGKSECLAILILFHMYTIENYKVVLITPFQSQVDLIFKRIEELLSGAPMLSNSVRRSVKAPQYSIELYNGSRVTGFTAGTKSNGGASSARGQDANFLALDEADMLSKADLDSVMAIVANHPDARVWMSSTPTGKRERFYQNCFDKDWKEFHYSSQVNPNWTTQLDEQFKKSLTSIGYDHEILANFGEQEQGVFQNAYIDLAVKDYKYSQMYPQNHWLYSIGVDWNSPKIGTTIYVTGFNQSTNKFSPVEHFIIQRDGWTQTAACQKIIELNRKWKPFAIYVDLGYGSSQIEMLRKFGYDARIDPERGPSHADSRMIKVLKAFDFGSSVEIRDPFTKEPRNKPAKGFLVENAVRRFENGEIIIPTEDAQLKRELLGYIIKHVTVTGQVVYTTIDDEIGDHNLDALMLSLVGFTLEKSQLGKPVLNEKIEFSSLDTKLPDNLQKKDTMPADRGELKGTDVSKKEKLWDWPGFGHDAPRPTKSGNMSSGGSNGRFRGIFKKSSKPSKRAGF